MEKKHSDMKLWLALGLVVTLMLSYSMAVGAIPLSFRANPIREQKIQFQDLELTVPAGTADQEMTVDQDDESYLTQIQLPFGFRSVSKPYRFGPHGIKFGRNQLLAARFKIVPETLPSGYSPQSAKLYYINPDTKTLDLVEDQQVDPNVGVLEAKLRHFSSYVVGVTPGWDGNGINSFMDYVHNGEENVLIYGLGLTVLSHVISLPGRGVLDFNLDRVYSAKTLTNNPFTLSQTQCWYWGATYYDFNNKRLYLPGGASYDANVSNGTEIDYGDVVFQVLTPSGGTVPAIFLKNGTIIQTANDYSYQTVTDLNGNQIRYNFTTFTVSGSSVRKLSSVVDSTGRQFRLNYTQTAGADPVLSNLQQQLTDGSYKTILTRTDGTNQVTYTDALNRATQYTYTSGYTDSVNRITQIIYPNGVKSTYTYFYQQDTVSNTSVYVVQNQQMFQSGASSPTRTVAYTVLNNNLNTVTVNDGVKIESYTLTNNNVRGYTAIKNTQDLTGKTSQTVNTAYYYTTNAQGNYVARVQTVSTQLAKSDGSLDSASVYTYNYDNWGNVTYIKDPNGTVTYMAYANTNNNGSNINLSQINSLFQDAQPLDTLIPLYEYQEYQKMNSSKGDQPRPYYLNSTRYQSSIYTGADLYYWLPDGVVYYVLTSQRPGTVPLYEYQEYQKTNSSKGDQPSPYYLNSTYYPSGISTGADLYYWKPDGVVYYTAQIRHDLMLTKGTQATDPVHNTTQLNQTHYQYDLQGNLLKERVVNNNPNAPYLDTVYTYDSYGNLTSRTDPLNNATLYSYNSGLAGINDGSYLTQVSSKEASGTTKTLATYTSFNEFGKPQTVTDPNGNVFNYAYDALGRNIKQTLANSDSNVGVSKVVAYNDASSFISIFYGNKTKGWQSGRINYDPMFGKPVKMQRLPSLLNIASDNSSDLLAALGASPSWQILKTITYDADGRVSSECDGVGNTTSYNYDSLNRVVKTTYPDSTYSTTSWSGLNTTKYDAKGNRRDEFYDLLFRLTSNKEYPDPANLSNSYTTSYVYDSASHLVQTTNPKNAQNKNTYDNLGRLVRVDFPQDGTNPLTAETYAYDNAGNLQTKTNAKGTQTMAYQFLGGYRLQQVTEPGGSTVGYTYDNNGNLLTQTRSGVTYTYSNYDARNRAHNLNALMDGYNFSFSYIYDTFGHMTNITYPGRSTPVQYDYDALDRLLDIPSFVTFCSYDAANRPTGMVYANGINNTWGYTYDRLTSIGVGSSLLNFNYNYDAIGNISQIQTQTSGQVTNDYYNYDGLNRLTWAGDNSNSGIGNGTTWGYDSAGNMTGIQKFSNSQIQDTQTLGYDLANRLWTKNTASYTNDAAGARTVKVAGSDTWNYTYDSEIRLTQVTKNGQVVEQNTYDGSGMRVKKVVGGNTTYYLYNGANPIVEYTPSDGKYTYYVFAGSSAIAEEKDGVKRFYHKDHLGSTRLVTDASGAVVANYKFQPYGAIENHTGVDVKPGFTGKENEAETGLSYYGFRWYDPEVGRFVTQDPVGAGGNWYVYCYDNPINLIDPWGLDVGYHGEADRQALNDYNISNVHISNGGSSVSYSWKNSNSSRTNYSTTANSNGAITTEQQQHKGFLGIGWVTDNRTITGTDNNGGTFSINNNGRVTADTNEISGNLLSDGLARYLNTFSIGERQIMWVNFVRTGHNWDFKSTLNDVTFVVNGEDYTSRQFGNINYGYTGSSLGFSKDILLRAAGLYQIISGTSSKEWGVPWGNSPYGDDPVDQEMIKIGISAYGRR